MKPVPVAALGIAVVHGDGQTREGKQKQLQHAIVHREEWSAAKSLARNRTSVIINRRRDFSSSLVIVHNIFFLSSFFGPSQCASPLPPLARSFSRPKNPIASFVLCVKESARRLKPDWTHRETRKKTRNSCAFHF